jgi:hypothetical protein
MSIFYKVTLLVQELSNLEFGHLIELSKSKTHNVTGN